MLRQKSTTRRGAFAPGLVVITVPAAVYTVIGVVRGLAAVAGVGQEVDLSGAVD